jgi:putative tryptophan/tyrosine transport system substrate-binding protein
MDQQKLCRFMLCALLFAICVPAHAQQPKKVWRIGYLATADVATESARVGGIRLALRERGYIEGQNINIEYRYSEGKGDRLPELAAELVHLKVDIIVVGGDNVILAAKNATKTIPIVMVGAGSDPVEAGFVEGLARPGGNITGITNVSPNLGGKRLELLKEAVPKLLHVAILYDQASAASEHELKEVLPVAARALKLTIQPLEVRSAHDFDGVFAAMGKQHPDGLYLPTSGSLIRSNVKRIVGFALKSRLPSMYVTRQSVEAGGLMCYGADTADSYRRVAIYVDKILKGAKPADLPVEQPTKVELIINLKTAKQIGVTIPQSMLYKADKVIR